MEPFPVETYHFDGCTYEGTGVTLNPDGSYTVEGKLLADWRPLRHIPPVSIRRPAPASYAASFDERVIGRPHRFEDLIAAWDAVVLHQVDLVAAHGDQRCLNTYNPGRRPCRICRDVFDNEWAWFHNQIVTESLNQEWNDVRDMLEKERREEYEASPAGIAHRELMESDYIKMMRGGRPEGCTCHMERPMRESLEFGPEPAEWQQDPDCPLHGENVE